MSANDTIKHTTIRATPIRRRRQFTTIFTPENQFVFFALLREGFNLVQIAITFHMPSSVLLRQIQSFSNFDALFANEYQLLCRKRMIEPIEPEFYQVHQLYLNRLERKLVESNVNREDILKEIEEKKSGLRACLPSALHEKGNLRGFF